MGTLRLNLLLAGTLALITTVTAEQKTAGAELTFVSEVAAIQPGVPFTIALHIRHQPSFHTYWKNPGIVGVPTSIEWKLPEGFEAGPIQWPAPEVVDMATHPAHGFHRDVLLLVEITPPKEIVVDSVSFAGDLTWMACHKECHPGWATRRITLPISRGTEAKLDPKWAAKIQKERQNLPVQSDLWTVTMESRRDASPIRIRIRPANASAGNPDQIYFFSEDGQISSEPPQTARRQKDGSYLIVAERSEYGPDQRASLPGILVASGTWAADQKLQAIRTEPSYPGDKGRRRNK